MLWKPLKKHLSEQKRWKLQAEAAEPRQKENKSRGLKDPEGAKKRREAASKVTVEVGLGGKFIHPLHSLSPMQCL